MRPLPWVVAFVLLAGGVARADHASVRQAHVATMANELKLDDATAERAQAIVDRYNARMTPLRRSDGELVVALRTQLRLSAPEAARMKSLSGELVRNRARLQALRDDRLRELQKLLTPEQFSRLLLRWPSLTRQFRREARSLMRR